jgi:hypothetical protein
VRLLEEDWENLRASAYDGRTSVSGRAMELIVSGLAEEGRFSVYTEGKKDGKAS